MKSLRIIERRFAVRDRRLLLGRWQSIALVECDGPREREIVVDVRS